jgi:DNA-binding transcriptional LysR family regulator
VFDLHGVRAFLAVCDHGTFTAAAAALRTTQPSLSRRIAVLEQEIGGALFDRQNRRSPRLSRLGSALLPQARQLVAEEARFSDLARTYSQARQEGATVAVSEITAELMLPVIYAYIQRHLRGLQLLAVQQPPGPAVREALRDGTVDMALMDHSYLLPGVQHLTLGVVQHMALGTHRFLGASDQPIEWDELRRMPLLLPVAFDDMRYSHPVHDRPKVALERGSAGLLRALARAGVGVMVVSAIREQSELTCRPIAIDGSLQKSYFDLVWSDTAALGQGARMLVDGLTRHLSRSGPVRLDEDTRVPTGRF